MTVVKCHHTPIGGVFYLAADFDVVCYDSRHWMMVLVAVSVGSLFCLGVPLMMVWMLNHNKEHLSDPAFFSRFGFLIDGYRPDTSWCVAPIISGPGVGRGLHSRVLVGDTREAGGSRW